MDRRRFIKTTGLGAAVLALPFGAVSSRAEEKPDTSFTLIAGPGEAQIYPGRPTGVWRYSARDVKARPGAVEETAGSYLGPAIRARAGDDFSVRLVNNLPEETIVHWHGLHVPADQDGHPRFAVGSGGRYDYRFKIRNRAGSYWYHPHPHGRTGPQVYGGLAGLLIVSDDEERAAGLPDGEFDLPLVIQDRTFDRSNQLTYLAGRMDRMTGFLGEVLLVNGRPDYSLKVRKDAYRLRVYNGSNSRIYRLAWDDGRPLTVIGTDGGLLDAPMHRPDAMLGPAQRLEIYVDFSDDAPGAGPPLVTRPFEAGFGGMGRGMGGRGRGMMSSSGPPQGTPGVIMRLEIEDKKGRPGKLPGRLSDYRDPDPGAAVNPSSPRRFFLEARHMAWTINGRLFEMTAVAPEERVRLGDAEVWEFVNAGGRMGMMGMTALPHPMHIHGLQFRVLGREGGMTDGFVDRGWQDTVLVMPGQRVRVMMTFKDYTGLYLYHCHNLEHEDMGMMRNYLVEA